MKTYPRSGPFTAIATNHLAFSTPDFRKTRDWYIGALGMEDVFDAGSMCAVRFGIPRNHIYIVQNKNRSAKPFIDHKSCSIEKFRYEPVFAELKARGLHASYDGPFMVETKDPEGFRLQPGALPAVFPGGGLPKNVEDLKEEDGLKAALRAAPRPDYKVFRATCVNHVSHYCVDYGKVRDYYMDLWSMRKISDDGKVAVVEFGGGYGDPPQQVWLRGGLRPGQKEYVDHVGYAIEDFDSRRVESELKRMGLRPRSAGPSAWAIDDVVGFPIQICDTKGVVLKDAYRPYA
ncbi:MAG TPA: VOC family protein [Candidatus Dormibacteraeota bacterium]|nr:VOC family protein [Candidatus Dormibacteraeota bacterium]